MVTISILIATYNRAGLLDECLTHLERQTFDAGDEVIIATTGLGELRNVVEVIGSPPPAGGG